MKTPLFILAALVGCFSPLTAQNSDIIKSFPLPPGAILVRAPELAHWQITYTNLSAPSATPMPKSSAPKRPSPRTPEPAQISVTKAGRVYHRETVYDDGDSMDQWWVNGTQVTQRRNFHGYVLSFRGDEDAFYIDYDNSDFPDFHWISRATYAGIQKLNGLECFVFKNTTPSAIQAKSDITAWVDIKTHLPVQLTAEGLKQIYTFLPTPLVQLTPPPCVVKEIAAWDAKKAQLSRPAPKP